MNIGILTLPLHINYGGILQAYALQTVLEHMGHEAYLISVLRRDCNGKGLLSKISSPLYLLKSYLNWKNKNLITNKFIRKYIKSKTYVYFCDIKSSDFDAIIVGSDQIWRSLFVPYIEDAFLNFTEGWNIKRIAYAVSFGSDIWDYNEKQTRNCMELIKRFDAVSLRESTGVELCKKYLKYDSNLVIDPTMLLDSDIYISLIKPNRLKTNQKQALFSYIIANTKNEQRTIEFFKKENKFDMKTIVLPDYHSNKRSQPTVNDWIQSIYYADYIYTDSFHCAVFSILFKKKFVIVDASNGSTRLKNLINMLNLSHEYIVDETTSPIDTLKTMMKIKVPEEDVYDALNRLRCESISFLEDNL